MKKLNLYYDEIYEEISERLAVYYVRNGGRQLDSVQVRKIVGDAVIDRHEDIRDAVRESSDQAAYDGYWAVKEQIEKEQRMKIALTGAALLYVYRDFTGRRLSDGRNFADRIRINHNKLIHNVAVQVPYKKEWEEIEKELEIAVRQQQNRTLNIQKQEAIRIYSEAEMAAIVELKEQGYSVSKRWVSMDDHLVRNSHASLHGQVVADDEEFVSESGATALGPHLFGVPEEDINCRCYIEYEVQRQDDI